MEARAVGKAPLPRKLERKRADLVLPRISVCLATCNGEVFISEQLDSVLKQLGPNDEVIVVDDASNDRTKQLVIALNEPRILLIEHTTRQGVVKTFEHAVRAASGDIVFLCDQDDLWAPQKVSRVMSVFQDHSDVTLVASKIQTIDEHGEPVHDPGSRPTRFSAGVIQNLISNRFQGSTMAFRSTLIPQIMPFPDGNQLFHDAWIGLRNTVTGGKSYYIDEPLLLYRRHSTNASRPLGLSGRILKRLRLVWALTLRWLADDSPGVGSPN